MKTYKCTEKYSNVRGFASHPNFGGVGIEIWLKNFDAEKFRFGLRKGKEKFPSFNTIVLDLSVEAWYLDREKYLQNLDKAFTVLKEEKLATIVRYLNSCASWPLSGIITAEAVNPNFIPAYRKYMQDTLKILADKDILIHDIINEPLNNTYGNFAAQKRIYNFVEAMHEEIVKVDSRPITIGSQGYFSDDDDFTRQGWMMEDGDEAVKNDIAFFLDLVDVISLHAYNIQNLSQEEYECKMRKKLDKLEALNKPVIITESCWAGKDDEARKSYLESEIPTYKKLGIGFSCHMLLTGKVPDSFPFDGRSLIEDGLYMAFLDDNYEIRKYHDIYND